MVTSTETVFGLILSNVWHGFRFVFAHCWPDLAHVLSNCQHVFSHLEVSFKLTLPLWPDMGILHSCFVVVSVVFVVAVCLFVWLLVGWLVVVVLGVGVGVLAVLYGRHLAMTCLSSVSGVVLLLLVLFFFFFFFSFFRFFISFFIFFIFLFFVDSHSIVVCVVHNEDAAQTKTKKMRPGKG